jgi:hypothetical protein
MISFKKKKRLPDSMEQEENFNQDMKALIIFIFRSSILPYIQNIQIFEK